MEAIRTCKCGKEAFTRDDLDEFMKDNRAPYGRANTCKLCHTKKYRTESFVPNVPLKLSDPLRTCNKCGVEAFTKDDLEIFQRANGGRFGRANMCKQCAVTKTIKNKNARPPMTEEQEAQYRKSQRKWHLKKTYNLTLKDYDIMLTEQHNCCKICKCKAYSERNAFREHLVVDHCHLTGDVRGLLCHQCNVALGGFKDDLELLEKALNYLTQA